MFNTNNSGYSLADIAAATGGSNNNGGFGFGDGDGAWIILLFLIFACGWGGNGGNGFFGGGNSTREEISYGFDINDMQSGIRQVHDSVSDGVYNLNTSLLNGFCDTQNAFAQNTAAITAAVTNGFNTQNLANLQNTNAIQRDIYANSVGNMQNTNAIQSQMVDFNNGVTTGISQIRYDMATDTCAINTNASNNTRDIIDSQNENTRAILQTLQQMQTNALQDKITALTSENQSLKFAASQAAQNAYLVDELRPCAKPAYITCSPYQSSLGCNCGCGNM